MDKKIKDYNQFIKVNESVNGSVRTRYAPSPTGLQHAGGIRTAIYNYLFAKKYGGQFLLRIEDTDSSRFNPDAEKYIKDTFDWLGIEFDESPSKGGPCGPYRQSERQDIYDKYLQILIDKGFAYYAFDTATELEEARENTPNFSYNYETRKNMINSLTQPDTEIERLLSENNDWVVRIKYPDVPVTIEVNDIVRGNVVVDSSTLDDKVIWKKKDELPTYHLANIVDDHLMKITHVIRGEEWLPSAPLHVYLYECFGWIAPKFAHLPLILGPTGGKLSKRDGDKFGFPVFPLRYVDPKDSTKITMGYKEDGYLPETVINMLAFIGWNPGTEKEVYTMDELIRDFDLKRINKAGGKFNPIKAAWFNGQHIKMTPTKDLMDSFKYELSKHGVVKDDEFIYKILDENKGKVNFIKELYDVVSFYFEKPKSYDEKVLKKWNSNSSNILFGLRDELNTITNWKDENIQQVFEKYVDDNKLKFGEIMPILRVVLTGVGNGTLIFTVMELIGKDNVIKRLSELDDFGNINSVQDAPSVETDSLKNAQMVKDLEVAKASLSGIESRLSNDNFISRAPITVVESEKKKAEELKIKIKELEKELNM